MIILKLQDHNLLKLLQLLPENLMPDTTFILGVLAKDRRAGRGCPRSCRRPRHLCTPRLGSMTPCGNTCQSMCDALLHAAGGAARRPPTCVCKHFGSYVKPCRPCYGISRSLLIERMAASKTRGGQWTSSAKRSTRLGPGDQKHQHPVLRSGDRNQRAPRGN